MLTAAGVDSLSIEEVDHSGEFLPIEAPEAFVDSIRRFRAECDAAVEA